MCTTQALSNTQCGVCVCVFYFGFLYSLSLHVTLSTYLYWPVLASLFFFLSSFLFPLFECKIGTVFLCCSLHSTQTLAIHVYILYIKKDEQKLYKKLLLIMWRGKKDNYSQFRSKLMVKFRITKNLYK